MRVRVTGQQHSRRLKRAPLQPQAFQALCDTGAGFPSQLVQAGLCAYEATQQDVRFLLPCLPALAKEELRALLPQIVALSSEEVVGAFRRILDVRAASPMRVRCG